MVNARNWSPADKFGAASFGLMCLVSVGGGVAYIRTDYTQASQTQVAHLTGQMSDLRAAAEKSSVELRADVVQRIAELQLQFAKMSDRLDRLPQPETMQEVHRRVTELEGRVNLLTNQLAAAQTGQATLEVRLQSLEKGTGIALPGRR